MRVAQFSTGPRSRRERTLGVIPQRRATRAAKLRTHRSGTKPAPARLGSHNEALCAAPQGEDRSRQPNNCGAIATLTRFFPLALLYR
jgi:hypothetical protein